MLSFISRRIRPACVRFALQACVWLVLSIAIASMLVLGGSFRWLDALQFSGTNWMPWAVITPIVFWVSRRFPVMRGHLARSVPIHLVACVVCTLTVSWIVSQVPFGWPRAGTVRGGSDAGAIRTVAFGSGTVVGAPIMSGQFKASGSVVSFATDDVPLSMGPFFTQSTVNLPSSPAFPANLPTTIDPTSAGPNLSVGPSMLPANGGEYVIRNGDTIVMGGQRMSRPMTGTATIMGAGGTVPLHPSFKRRPWQMFLVPLALRANVGFAIYFIIASAAHAMAFYRQAQERERQSLALAASRNQAKLDALQLQLQPHFLFNTLNAISTLVHRDADAADRLIGDLSDLLRVSLQTTAHEVTLQRELELLDHYLAIEKARLGDRLRIVREIDPAVIGAYVPTFILQPLAENAVRHGLEPRLDGGTLTLRAVRDGDTVRLTVADDGVGFDPKIARRARRGIGLANSEERLRTLHDDRARLDFISPSEGGVRIDISLPFRMEPAAPPSGNHRRERINSSLLAQVSLQGPARLT
jgi:hypothetical protein